LSEKLVVFLEFKKEILLTETVLIIHTVILQPAKNLVFLLNFLPESYIRIFTIKIYSGGKMNIKTHNKINPKLSGEVIEFTEGKTATVRLETNEDMLADDKGLIHGGFIFSNDDKFFEGTFKCYVLDNHVLEP